MSLESFNIYCQQHGLLGINIPLYLSINFDRINIHAKQSYLHSAYVKLYQVYKQKDFPTYISISKQLIEQIMIEEKYVIDQLQENNMCETNLNNSKRKIFYQQQIFQQQQEIEILKRKMETLAIARLNDKTMINCLEKNMETHHMFFKNAQSYKSHKSSKSSKSCKSDKYDKSEKTNDNKLKIQDIKRSTKSINAYITKKDLNKKVIESQLLKNNQYDELNNPFNNTEDNIKIIKSEKKIHKKIQKKYHNDTIIKIISIIRKVEISWIIYKKAIYAKNGQMISDIVLHNNYPINKFKTIEEFYEKNLFEIPIVIYNISAIFKKPKRKFIRALCVHIYIGNVIIDGIKYCYIYHNI